MFKVSTLLFLSLLFNACASSSKRTSLVPVVSKSVLKHEKLKKYAIMEGCRVTAKGYMICPKSYR